MARAEKAAQHGYKAARAVYRRAWWDLTLSLKDPTDSEIKRVNDEIQAILGQTRGHLAERRSLARHIDAAVIESGAVYSLPPRMSLAWKRAKGKIDQSGVEALRQYDADPATRLRDMYAELVGPENLNESWKREGQRQAERTAELEAARRATPTPEQIVQAIRSNPGVRRAVVQDSTASRAIYDEHAKYDSERVNSRYGSGNIPPKPNPDQAQFSLYEIIDDGLMEARRTLRKVARSLDNYAPAQDEADRWSGLTSDLIIIAQAINDRLTGISEFDAGLRELLSQEEGR